MYQPLLVLCYWEIRWQDTLSHPPDYWWRCWTGLEPGCSFQDWRLHHLPRDQCDWPIGPWITPLALFVCFPFFLRYLYLLPWSFKGNWKCWHWPDPSTFVCTSHQGSGLIGKMVMRQRLDLMMSEVFYNLNDSMILWFCNSCHPCS